LAVADRLTHTDVRIGGWLVEPRGRDSLLAPTAQQRDQPLETVGCRQRGLSIAPIVAVDRCVRARFSCA
jgi:hypothetical protein